MTGAEIATAYLNALENEDVAAVLALFQPEAIAQPVLLYPHQLIDVLNRNLRLHTGYRSVLIGGVRTLR